MCLLIRPRRASVAPATAKRQFCSTNQIPTQKKTYRIDYRMFDICIWPFYQLDAGRPFFSVLLPWSFTIYALQNQVPRGKNIKYVLVLYKQFRLIKICVGRQYLKLPLNYHGQIKAKSPGLGRWNSKIHPSPLPPPPREKVHLEEEVSIKLAHF